MLRSHTGNKINLPSAVELFRFHGRKLYIKRDDLIDQDLSGNKFRKLFFLLNSSSADYKRIISYGGSQSNAMASIAALSKRQEWRFIYVTKALSSTLRQNLEGNLKAAIDDGMELVEVPHEQYREVVESLYSPAPYAGLGLEDGDLVLAQGGADLGAREGIVLLAEEIAQWKHQHKVEKLTVVTPSGTGTTAYFLAMSLPDITVITTPLIGSKEYLFEQMDFLGPLPENLAVIETEKKYRFAKTYPEYLALYNMFLDQGVEIDLLYAPKMLRALSETLADIEGDILYVHSGGVKGNHTMLARYRFKGLL